MTDFKYQLPPPEIADLINAPLRPDFIISPDSRYVAVLEPHTYLSIDELSQPEVKLAGLSINMKSHAPSRSGMGYKRITFINLDDTSNKKYINLPEDQSRILSFSWSPKGDNAACAIAHKHGVDLAIVSAETGGVNRIITDRLNCIYGEPFYWAPDGTSLICKLRYGAVKRYSIQSDIPNGPLTYESKGEEAPARTYPDALKTPQDAEMLEYFLKSRICSVSLKGKSRYISAQMMIKNVLPSPDGKYLLIERVEQPFSFSVLLNRFAHRIEIIDMKGRVVRVVGYRPLDEQRPIGKDAVSKGVREAGWRSDKPSTVFWVEALDGGDHRVSAEFRDRICQLDAPFQGSPFPLLSMSYRFQDVWWSTSGYAFVAEQWWKTRRKRIWLIDKNSPENMSKVLFDLSIEDRYNDPGVPLLRQGSPGCSVTETLSDGHEIILSGSGASDKGDRPFVDSFNISSLKSTRIWQSESPYYEKPLSLLDQSIETILTILETQDNPPNLCRRDLREDTLQMITDFPNPYPGLTGVHKEIITYEREDGIQLNGTLYLPPAYTKNHGPCPAIIWAYPREFKSADTAGQMKGSPYMFPRLSWSSPLFLLTQGYAVLDGPSMPIIGEGDMEPNDQYIKQLSMNAKAAVNALVSRGIAYSDKIAIGGHSYGAFMAVNLLVHTNLFMAGIARNGAYNRMLTPFGFQYEERNLWDARETYLSMSPYLFVDKIDAPLLILHGLKDNNPGTSPVQSEFLYKALKGLGKKARLVMFPNEGHQYRSLETVMHMAWEMSSWLERHIK